MGINKTLVTRNIHPDTTPIASGLKKRKNINTMIYVRKQSVASSTIWVNTHTLFLLVLHISMPYKPAFMNKSFNLGISSSVIRKEIIEKTNNIKMDHMVK